MTDLAREKLRKYCIGLYGVYALGAALIPTDLALFGGILVLVALAAGHYRKKAAAGTVYENHLRWLSRTFWIANVYYVATGIVGMIYLYAFTDFAAETAALMDMVNGGDPDALGHMTAQMEKMEKMTVVPYLITSVPPSVWWIYRCWQGHTAVRVGQPVDNVTRWI